MTHPQASVSGAETTLVPEQAQQIVDQLAASNADTIALLRRQLQDDPGLIGQWLAWIAAQAREQAELAQADPGQADPGQIGDVIAKLLADLTEIPEVAEIITEEFSGEELASVIVEALSESRAEAQP